MAFAYSKDFEDGVIGNTVYIVDELEGLYVPGRDDGVGLGWYDEGPGGDNAGLVRFRASDTPVPVDQGIIGLDFVRHGPYGTGALGAGGLIRVGHIEDGVPTNFGVALAAASDGSFEVTVPGVEVTYSAPGLIAENVWYLGSIEWSGMDVTFKVVNLGDNTTLFEHTTTMLYPPTDHAIWAPHLIGSPPGFAYEVDIDNVFYNSGVVVVSALRRTSRDFARGY